MITGDKMPLVSDTESFTNVLNTISEYKLGMAMILDSDQKELSGVLTDGDIRRTIIKYPNSSNVQVKDVMTVQSKRITEDGLCSFRT